MGEEGKIQILAVDDEVMNLDLMEYILKKKGYKVRCASSGDEAWDYLQKYPEEIDLILLDRMMPGLDGTEVLARIHHHPILRDIPVIMQTASVGSKEIENSIANGAYYYLTKPYREDMLLAVVNSASEAARYRLMLKENIRNTIKSYSSAQNNVFELRTFEDVQAISAVLANYFPQSQNATIVLYELLLNALEHGNLGIGYETKKKLVSNNIWREELERRLKLPENLNKVVNVYLERTDTTVSVTIIDEGKGFDWTRWVDFDPLRMTEANGRGIAKAHIMGTYRITYGAPGNKVTCYSLLSF